MKKSYKNLIIAISLTTFLQSCELFWEPMPKSWKCGAMPRPLTGVKGLPSADTAYGQGFKDGCGSAWDAVAKGLLGEFNKHNIDSKRLVNDSDYNTGWEDGIEHCTYMLDWNVI